jgi:hypothetical protein
MTTPPLPGVEPGSVAFTSTALFKTGSKTFTFVRVVGSTRMVSLATVAGIWPLFDVPYEALQAPPPQLHGVTHCPGRPTAMENEMPEPVPQFTFDGETVKEAFWKTVVPVAHPGPPRPKQLFAVMDCAAPTPVMLKPALTEEICAVSAGAFGLVTLMRISSSESTRDWLRSTEIVTLWPTKKV